MIFQTNEKHRLQVIRGTTKVIRITIRDAAGNLYTPHEGDIVRFGVKISSDSTRCLIEYETAEIADSIALFRLSPEDTSVLDCGEYRYDVGLQSGPDYLNVIPYATFSVLPNITGKKPTDAEGGAEDVTELEGTVEVVPGSSGSCLSVAGAAVGQTIKIAEVDENGVPTAWEPVDFPSGEGAEEEWELAAEFTTEEDVGVILQSLNAAYKKIRYVFKCECDASNVVRIAVNSRPGAADRAYVGKFQSNIGIIYGEFDVSKVYANFEGYDRYLAEYGAGVGAAIFDTTVFNRESRLYNSMYLPTPPSIYSICVFTSGGAVIKAGANCVVYGVRV